MRLSIDMSMECVNGNKLLIRSYHYEKYIFYKTCSIQKFSIHYRFRSEQSESDEINLRNFHV